MCSCVRRWTRAWCRCARSKDVRWAHALWSPPRRFRCVNSPPTRGSASTRRGGTRDSATRSIDAPRWRARSSAYRLVHGEADGLPSLVVDQYDRWLVVQLLSAGLEAHRTPSWMRCAPTRAVRAFWRATMSARANARGSARRVELLFGTVPQQIGCTNMACSSLRRRGTDRRPAPSSISARIAPWWDASRGRALDCFAYHGSFALHLARGATEVTAVDVSAPALARGGERRAQRLHQRAHAGG
jgi:hypothetical protein